MAGGGASVEVGRITVKVTPDTKGFARKLRQDLAKLRDNFNVDINPDTKGVREKVKAATKGMTAKVKIDADVDHIAENFRKKIELLDLNWDRKAKDFFGVEKFKKEFDKLDLNWDKKVADFQKELRQSRVDLQPQVLKDKSETVNMKVELDHAIAEAKLAAWKAKEANDKISVAVVPDVQMGRFALARAKIQAIFARPVEVEVTPGAGIAGSGNWMTKTMPSFGSGINAQGYMIIAAALTAITPLIAGTIGLISTALTAVPGLIATVMVPIGALALGLDGLKEAATVLQAPFEELKAVMSTNVKEQFTPVFETLAGLFPSLKATLPTVTKGMADIGQAIADMVTDPAVLGSIERSITNIGSALTQMSPGIADFVKGFTGLIEGFTSNLPGVADWINETGKSFTKWVDEFTAKGPDGVSKMDVALGNMGDSLKTIGGGLVELIGKGLDFFSDPEKVQSFKAELDGLINTILSVSDAINWMAAQFSKLPGLGDGKANGIMDFAPMQIQAISSVDWGSVFRPITDAATSAWNLLKTVWAPVGSFFAGVFSQVAAIATPVWNVISAAASAAWNVISAVWGGARDFLAGIWAGLSEAATPVWEAIKTGASAAWAAIQSALSPVTGFFSSIWDAVKGVVSSAASDIVNTITSLGNSIVSIIQSIDLFSAGKAMIQKLISGITSMIGAVKDAVSSVVGGIMNLFPHSPAKEGPMSGAGWTSIATSGQAIGEQFGKGLENGFQPVLEQAKGMAQQIADAFANGGDPTGFLDGYSKQDVKQMTSALGIQSKQLEMQAKALEYQASTSGDKSLQESLRNRAKEIRMQKDQIGLQNDMLKMTQDYNSELDTGKNYNEEIGKSVGKLMGAPVDFSKAVGGQFLSDLGIGGNGFISKLISEGTKYVFNVGSMDDAIAGQRVMQNRELLGRTQR